MNGTGKGLDGWKPPEGHAGRVALASAFWGLRWPQKDTLRLSVGAATLCLHSGSSSHSGLRPLSERCGSQNFAVVNWWKKFVPNTFENVPEREGAVPGIPVSVMQYSAQALAPDAMIRPVCPDDLPRCVELINRTHAAMDLFRPYSAEYLESILDEGFWGERPRKTGNAAMDWWESTYGWNDFFVLEEQGRIRACAGLWDRGRDVRERWRRPGTNEERIVAVAALMDFGFEDGAEECMERMIHDFIGRARRLGRDYLAAPIEHLPTLAARMEELNPEPDARSLRWGIRDLQIARPYVDMRYW